MIAKGLLKSKLVEILFYFTADTISAVIPPVIISLFVPCFDSLVGIASFFCVAFLLLNNSKNIRIALVLNVIVSMTSSILNTTIVAIIFYNRYKPTLIVIGTVFYVGISLGFAYNTFRYTRRLDKFNKLAWNVAGARI